MSTMKSTKVLLNPFWLSMGFVVLLSYFTYFDHYSDPQKLIWDENYYIPSAQKYLNGTFFMHAHPPLGQLLIALGEKIVHANITNNQFINIDNMYYYVPKEFSFTGYRLIPVLLAWLTAPLIFGIFLLLTRNHFFAALLSLLYIFDNALIVHLRAAMLEGPLLFFTALSILLFLLLLESTERLRSFVCYSILFGVSCGLLSTTKQTGFILLLLFPSLLFQIWPNWKKFSYFFVLSSCGFVFAFVTVWQIHFALVSHVNSSLPNNGYYKASKEYKQILTERRNGSLLSFPVMLRDSFKYSFDYHQSVPRLDLCNPDEKGSPPFFWPFGARAIDYLWNKVNEKSWRYLYLQSNPVVWIVGLIGVVFASALILSSLLLQLKKKLQHRFLLTTFLVLYVGYMIAMSTINRAMYLYHYFIPLLFSWLFR